MKKSDKSKLNVIAGEYLKKHHKRDESKETEAEEGKESSAVQLAEKITKSEKHTPKFKKK